MSAVLPILASPTMTTEHSILASAISDRRTTGSLQLARLFLLLLLQRRDSNLSRHRAAVADLLTAVFLLSSR